MSSIGGSSIARLIGLGIIIGLVVIVLIGAALAADLIQTIKARRRGWATRRGGYWRIEPDRPGGISWGGDGGLGGEFGGFGSGDGDGLSY